MKKKGKKIKHGRISAPTLIALQISPEVETSERMALLALTQEWGDEKHFNVLLDCQHMLTLAAEHKRDQTAISMAQFADIAMKNIRDRWKKHGKLRATGDELSALRELIDFSSDWWRRQAGTLFQDAYFALDRLRETQRKAA